MFRESSDEYVVTVENFTVDSHRGSDSHRGRSGWGEIGIAVRRGLQCAAVAAFFVAVFAFLVFMPE